MFTSLLRLELIDDAALRAQAADILARRDIFTAGVRALIAQYERDGGLGEEEARRFVAEALETFRWHGDATVSRATYQALSEAASADRRRGVLPRAAYQPSHAAHAGHRRGPGADAGARDRGQGGDRGPPPRAVPILLRQTSFKALEEAVSFPNGEAAEAGTHTARFGEIEQRGLALTPKGRALYDALLDQARDAGAGSTGADYPTRLAAAFAQFPDDLDTLRREGLGYFRYTLTGRGRAAPAAERDAPAEVLIARGLATADPIVYEDFLPVSAAGIFQSNLGGGRAACLCGQRASGGVRGGAGRAGGR